MNLPKVPKVPEDEVGFDFGFEIFILDFDFLSEEGFG